MAFLPLGLTIWSYRVRWQQRRSSPAFRRWNSPVEVVEHVAGLQDGNGAAALQIGVDGWSAELAAWVRERCEALNIALEGQIELPTHDGDLERFERSLLAGKAAGATIFRAYCLLERRYETFTTRTAWENWHRLAVATLERVEPILARHQVRLAVENHKDWRSAEQAAVFRRLGSPWLGICLDFGNNLSLLEDPLEAARNLAPWIISTHVKDMGLRSTADGFLLSEVPLGTGLLDIPALVEICHRATPGVRFLLEMISRDPLPVPCLRPAYRKTFAEFPAADLDRTLRLAAEGDRRRLDLPRESGLDDASALSLEERLIRESLCWWNRTFCPTSVTS